MSFYRRCRLMLVCMLVRFRLFLFHKHGGVEHENTVIVVLRGRCRWSNGFLGFRFRRSRCVRLRRSSLLGCCVSLFSFLQNATDGTQNSVDGTVFRLRVVILCHSKTFPRRAYRPG